jgi:hypothetical protein
MRPKQNMNFIIMEIGKKTPITDYGDILTDAFYGVGFIIPLNENSFDLNIKYMEYPDSSGSKIKTYSAGLSKGF